MYTEIKNVPPGYPSVAALVSKDNDFAIFRKFRYLNARNLLYLQAELVDLENELETFDRSLQVKDDIGELKSWKKFAADEDRWNLVLRIRKTLDEYNRALLQLGEVANLQSPSKTTVKNFDGWIKDWQHISDCSKNFLESTIPRGTGPLRMKSIVKIFSYWMKVWQHKRNPNSMQNVPSLGTVPPQIGKLIQYSEENSELATISRRADSLLGRFLKRTPLNLLFTEDKVRHKTTGGFIVFYPPSKIEAIARAISIILAVALTVVAVVALGIIPQQKQARRLGLVGGFTLLVAGVLALSGARKAEVLMGTIGYVAILVVFVVGQQSG